MVQTEASETGSSDSMRRGNRRMVDSTGSSLGAARPNDVNAATTIVRNGRGLRVPAARPIANSHRSRMVCGYG